VIRSRPPGAALVAFTALACLALLLPAEGRSATAIEATAAEAPSTTAAVSQSAVAARAPRVIRRVNRSWVCSRRVNLDLVKVTLRTLRAQAIYFRPGCTGRIGRIEVDTWTQDGIAINRGNGRVPAHDLVIRGGYIRCHDHVGGHQDGVQVADGRRITFYNFRIRCGRVNERGTNAQFYVSGSSAPNIPRRVLCINCLLGTGAASPLFIGLSHDSGARNTRVCVGDFGWAIRVQRGLAVRPVRVNLRVLRRSHPSC